MNELELLTICIPTFERYAFLEWTLRRTRQDFPTTPILISDNASAAPGQLLALKDSYQAHYIRQPQNIGAFPNMRAALLAAQTKYCVFLADDDYLHAERISEAIDYLEANPDVVAYYAPCQLYNEVGGESDWDAFYPAECKKFERGDELWNFVIGRHVWPEHAVYRRAALDKIMQPRLYAYWCFVDLANAVKQGPVYFSDKPYYRNITRHPVGPRVKLGDQQCLTDFDAYRAGLEVLAYDLFAPYFGQRPALLRQVKSGIDAFIHSRLEVAYRLHAANQRPEAAEFYKRLLLSRPIAP